MSLLRNSACIAVLASVPAIALAQDRMEANVIVATGEGVSKGAPDQAWVRIGTESRAKASKDAQQRNATVMSAVQGRLTSLSIPKEAIKTVGLDLQLEFDYRDGKQTPREYVARNTIEVRVDDLGRLGEVLDASVAAGATAIHGVRFDVKERSGLEHAALHAAVKNGLAKADAIASGSGRAVDRVIRIEEQFAGGGGAEPMQRMYAMAKAEATTPVAAGEIEIRAQVRVTVSMK